MIFEQQIIKLQRHCRDARPCVSTMAILLLLFWSPKSVTAQNTTDFGAILRAEYENNFYGNFDILVKEDLRFEHDLSKYTRSKTTLGFDYKFIRYGIKVGAGFEYVNKYTESRIFRNRYRLFVKASYKYAYHNWEFGYRTRFLMMYRDEATGYYNYTPVLSWRNRLQVSYQRHFSRFKYSLSGELYSDFNKDKRLQLNTLMFEGDVEYRLTRRQYLTVFVRDYREVYIESDQIRTVFVGIGWKFKH